MSTIRVDNFGPSAGGTTYSARGIAKSWVNFDGTGTIAIRDSENVASITDNGSGDYTVNFSNAFGAANYAVSGIAGEINDNATVTVLGFNAPIATASSAPLLSNNDDAGATDPVIVSITTLGDLA